MEKGKIEISSTTYLHIRKRLYISLEGSGSFPQWKIGKKRTPYGFWIFLGPFQIRLYWDFFRPKQVRTESEEKPTPADYGLPESPQIGDWRVLGGILSRTGDVRQIARMAEGFCNRTSNELKTLGYQEVGLPQLIPADPLNKFGQDEMVALRIIARYVGPDAENYFQMPWELPFSVIKEATRPEVFAHCKNIWPLGEFNETFEEFLEGKQLTKAKDLRSQAKKAEEE